MGFFRIVEQALNTLGKDDYEEVRQAGVLPLIYCQLLSMQHLQALVRSRGHSISPTSRIL
ncbi:MAG: SapC family protein [Deltaproteobacteria bacterium]|nr:SapC family protein [Deltaproteobacteria bacterium]